MIYEGRLSAPRERGETSVEEIGLLMAGMGAGPGTGTGMGSNANAAAGATDTDTDGCPARAGAQAGA